MACSPKEAGQLSQQMIIHSNDPASGLVRVDLSCRGAEAGDAELIAKEERKRRSRLTRTQRSDGDDFDDSDYADCEGDDCFDDVLYGPDGQPILPTSDDGEIESDLEAEAEGEGDEDQELADCSWEQKSDWVPCGFGSYSCTPQVQISQPSGAGPPPEVCFDIGVVHMAMGEYAEFESACVPLSYGDLGEASAQVSLTAHDSYGGVSTIKGTLTTGTARTAVDGQLIQATGVPFSGDSGSLVFVGSPSGVSTFGKALMVRLPMTASGCQ